MLIVDDNVDAAESMAALLRFDGHQVQVAYEGEQALACVEAFRPDVGLIDLGLPGMSGFELAKRLQQMNLNGCRLVALTGYGQPEDRARTKEAGFSEHLVKPVAHSSLERAVAGIPATADAVPGGGFH